MAGRASKLLPGAVARAIWAVRHNAARIRIDGCRVRHARRAFTRVAGRGAQGVKLGADQRARRGD